MNRCRCGSLGRRSTWGRLPVSLRAWLLLLRHDVVYECHCGHVWTERQNP